MVDMIEQMFDHIDDDLITGRQTSTGEPDDDDQLPPELDSIEPGPLLAAMMSIADVDRVSAHDAVLVLRACRRLVSHFEARAFRAMVSILHAYEDMFDDLEWVEDAAATEVRAALHLTRRAASRDLGIAGDLWERFPQVGAALEAGRIDSRRAAVILDHTTHLSPEAGAKVVDRILERAGELTTGQLAECLRRLAIEAEPAQARLRYEEAVEGRRVVCEPTSDGTAHLLGLDLPPDVAAAAADRIDHLARQLKTRDEPRSIDQLRADVFLDLLCGGATQGRAGTIDIRVDLATLAELAEHPGDLAGFGPVVADIARRAARAADRWQYTVTDPDDGSVIDTGLTRRRPTPAQRRAIEANYPTCIFLGCRIPSHRCDIDHRVPYAHGGPTDEANLGPVCRHDHGIRHLAGWNYARTATGGHRWTSPLGHTYTSRRDPP
ncbi:MAG: DUF222 domain-containing protein [Acidimicrobiia bacterium]